MANAKKSKTKSYSYKEFQKEFLTKQGNRKRKKKDDFYELGVKIARECLGPPIQKLTN